jgi:hypothetical protein
MYRQGWREDIFNNVSRSRKWDWAGKRGLIQKPIKDVEVVEASGHCLT